MAMYNNSRLKDYEKCPRRYYYSAILKLRKMSEWADIDRDEGLLLHDVLATYLDPANAGEDRYTLSVGVINIYYNALIAEAALDIEAEQYDERRDYLTALWDAYLERYKDEEWNVQAVEVAGFTCLGDSCYTCYRPYHMDAVRGKVAIETCTGCHAPIFYIAGQADVLIIENGVWKTVDHKTKGGKSPSISDAFLASFNESRQFTQYMYIFSRTTGEEMAIGIANCIAKLKTIDKRGNPFKRNDEITRTKKDYDEYVKDTLELIFAIEHDASRLDANNVPLEGDHYPFRRNTDACRDFGLCPYYALCHPSRPDFWTIPFDAVHDYERAPDRYVDEFEQLVKEEVR